jgi:hypothetical protein
MSVVCVDCIGESFLQQQIVEGGNIATCNFCGSRSFPTIDLDEVAERVHSALSEHFYMTSPDPEGLDYLAAKYGC